MYSVNVEPVSYAGAAKAPRTVAFKSTSSSVPKTPENYSAKRQAKTEREGSEGVMSEVKGRTVNMNVNVTLTESTSITPNVVANTIGSVSGGSEIAAITIGTGVRMTRIVMNQGIKIEDTARMSRVQRKNIPVREMRESGLR